jgi:hypothetical protein
MLRTCDKILYGMVSKCMPTARLHELVQNMYIGHKFEALFFHICTVHSDVIQSFITPSNAQ